MKRHEDSTTKTAKANNNYSFFDNLSVYEPIYFLVGPSPLDAKFQLSFKYHLFNGGKAFGAKWPLLNGLYFAYTQTSFWDLGAPSKPFTDSSFRPELFYCGLVKSFGAPKFKVQVGIFHESNGKSGPDSRSLNAVYVKPILWMITSKQGPDSDPHVELTVAAQFWQYIGSLSDNPNIGDYRGHASLQVSFGDTGGLMVSSQLRGGIVSGKGNVSADVSYPLSAIPFIKLDLFLYAQVYSGYGEDLLDYDHKDTRFRIGLALARP